MSRNNKNKLAGIVIIVAILVISFTPQMQSYFMLPGKQKVTVGDQIKIDLLFPESILKNFVVQLEDGRKITTKDSFKLGNKNWPVALQPGKVNLNLKLFGIIPVKEMVVDVLPPKKVIPSGHSVGVVVNSDGVMVVGYSDVCNNTKRYSPAKEAGILVGDVITEANSKEISSDDQLSRIVANSAEKKKNLNLTVNRNGKKLKFNLKPKYCSETGKYKIGLYVRDTAAGVGTMTFYHPETRKFAALGHVIANTEIQEHINKGVGKILQAKVQGIQKGKQGTPGEKIGIFMDDKNSFKGTINKNSRFGIYGKLKKLPSNAYYKEPIPVAYANQIKEGNAEILTVISGNKVEKFSVMIEKVIPHQKINGKGLVLKITDKRLLNATGGIIQGMSGSPIIQNGKLVGAVTHVYINDPTRGYGILAEWMLQENGLLKNNKRKVQTKIAA